MIQHLRHKNYLPRSCSLAASGRVCVLVPRGEERAIVTPHVGDPSAEGLFELVRQPMSKFLRSGQHFQAAIPSINGHDSSFWLGRSRTLRNVMDPLLDCLMFSCGGVNQKTALAFLL
jgi:hypothetical protein